MMKCEKVKKCDKSSKEETLNRRSRNSLDIVITTQRFYEYYDKYVKGSTADKYIKEFSGKSRQHALANGEFHHRDETEWKTVWKCYK